MIKPFTQNLLLIILTTVLSSPTAIAQDHKFDIDGRFLALFGDGVPANDMLGQGIGGRYHLNDGWFISGALEFYTYDLERPIQLVGLMQDPAIKDIDSKTDLFVISAGLGRDYKTSHPSWSWYWNLGIGAGFPDAADATGPLANGDPFRVIIDTGTEFHLQGKLGLSWAVTPRLSLIGVARAEHHFIDQTFLEVNTGATGKVDSHAPLGLHFGLRISF